MCKCEMRFFSLKKTRQIRKYDKMCFVQSMLHRLLYIFSIFRAICEYHVNENLPLLLRTIRRFIFHIFVRTKALPNKCVKSSMQTSGNRKEPSTVSKTQDVEFPSLLIPTYRKLVLPYITEYCHEEK